MENPFFSKGAVIDYYNKTLTIYLTFYSKDHFHHGMWYKDTRNQNEALENTTKFVVECLELKDDDYVLDAGCGIGGTTRYIVSNFGVKTTGINISDIQIEKAKQLSKSVKNAESLAFLKQDFCETKFPDESFTKICAIESACHAPLQFVKEAYRLLRKEGKLVICDAFQTRGNLNKKEKKLFLGVLKGYVLPRSELKENLIKNLYQLGFKHVKFHDRSQALAKSFWQLHRSAKQRYPVTLLLSKLRLIPQLFHDFNIAHYNLKQCVERQFVTYGVLVADK